jgi:hypothetical protein
MIDLGSDTVSARTLAMPRAAADAPAGLDPNVLALERRTADRSARKAPSTWSPMTTIPVREAM